MSLTAELEAVIDKKVKSGMYNNASEVVRDALRTAFCKAPKLDLQADTPELAALLKDGRRGPFTEHKKGDMLRLLAKTRKRVGT